MAKERLEGPEQVEVRRGMVCGKERLGHRFPLELGQLGLGEFASVWSGIVMKEVDVCSFSAFLRHRFSQILELSSVYGSIDCVALRERVKVEHPSSVPEAAEQKLAWMESCFGCGGGSSPLRIQMARCVVLS